MASAHRLIPKYASYPLGFSCSSVHCGVKASSPRTKRDLAVIVSSSPCRANAALFTTNQFQAAPVLECKRVVAANSPIHALVVNSGCANACTGEQGLADARATGRLVESEWGLPPDSVFVMSTGVIGGWELCLDADCW